MTDYYNVCKKCLRRIELTEDERGNVVWTHRDPFVALPFEAFHLPVPMV